MKKYILLTLSLLFAAAGLCRADFVNKETVQEIAARWFGSEDFTVELNESNTLYYVNANEGGWIIISAEDSTTPVIGYNDTGSINPHRMPSNMKAWFDNTYIKGIQEARHFNMVADEPVKQLWKTAGFRTKAATGKVLETALWDQDTPYNTYCPQVTESGRKVTGLTGCVATSACIILRYHQWPDKGRGTTQAYTFRDASNKQVSVASIDLSSHSYDFSQMPLKYSSSATSTQKQQVARLMADMGAACKLEYGYYEGTGGYAEDMLNAFVYHFKYNPQASSEYKTAYTDAEWIALIKNEIDNDRPVPYGGYSNDSGGHQYVCDGYDKRDYLHINWGWSGEDNGFFTFKMGTSQYYFDLGHSIIINLYPDKSGDSYEAPNGGPLFFGDYSSVKGGLTVTSGSVASKSFTVKASGIFNYDWHNAYIGPLRIVLIDHKGEVKQAISSESNVNIQEENYLSSKNFTCSVTGNYAIGDRIACQFRNKLGEWETIRSDYDALFTTTAVPFIPVFDTPYLADRTEYSAGDNYVIDLIPGSKRITSYTWKLDGKSQSYVSASLTAGEHTVEVTVTLSDNSKFVITKKITAN